MDKNFDENKAIDMASRMGEKATQNDIEIVAENLDSMKRGPLERIWDKVLELWEAFNSPNTPSALKVLIIGALIYMVSPIDLVPDAIPLFGLLDDVAVITYAFTVLLRHPECRAIRVYPEKGDIICKNSVYGLYQHYGIYIGDGRVIHFSGPKGQEINPFEADILETSLTQFLKGEKLYIVRERKDSKLRSFSPDEIVSRAKSQLGRQKGQYDLVFNNCEHFAYWCRFGIKKSQQVEDVAAYLVSFIGKR